MNRKKKLLIVLLSVIFCLSAFTLSVYAVGEDGGEYSDVIPGDNQGGGESSGGDVVIPPENSGSGDNNGDNNGDNGDNNGGNGDNNGDNGDNNGDNGDNNGGSDDNNNGNNGDNNGGYIDNNNSSSYVDNNGTDYGTDYGNDYNNGYDEQGGYEQDYNYDEPSYLGGGQTYVAPQNTAPSAALYNSSGSVGDKTLNSNDWNDISERLKNASNSADDGDDFSFIQKNDSLSDNGGWMLVVSVVCFALSAAGILYFIVLTVQNKKKGAFAAATNTGRMSKSNSSRDYYGDGYRAASAKSSKKSSKFDTAEVSLPKNTQGKRYKNGGRRYR